MVDVHDLPHDAPGPPDRLRDPPVLEGGDRPKSPEGLTAGDPRGRGREQVPPVERGADPAVGLDASGVQPVGSRVSQRMGQRSEHAVVGPDEDRTLPTADRERGPLASHPRVDDRDVDGAGREARCHGAQDERRLGDAVARQFVREVDEGHGRACPEQGAFICAA